MIHGAKLHRTLRFGVPALVLRQGLIELLSFLLHRIFLILLHDFQPFSGNLQNTFLEFILFLLEVGEARSLLISVFLL